MPSMESAKHEGGREMWWRLLFGSSGCRSHRNALGPWVCAGICCVTRRRYLLALDQSMPIVGARRRVRNRRLLWAQAVINRRWGAATSWWAATLGPQSLSRQCTGGVRVGVGATGGGVGLVGSVLVCLGLGGEENRRGTAQQHVAGGVGRSIGGDAGGDTVVGGPRGLRENAEAPAEVAHEGGVAAVWCCCVGLRGGNHGRAPGHGAGRGIGVVGGLVFVWVVAVGCGGEGQRTGQA